MLAQRKLKQLLPRLQSGLALAGILVAAVVGLAMFSGSDLTGAAAIDRAHINLVPLDHVQIACSQYIGLKIFTDRKFDAHFKVWYAGRELEHTAQVVDADTVHQESELLKDTSDESAYTIRPPYTDVEIDTESQPFTGDLLVEVYDKGGRIRDTLLVNRDCIGSDN